MNEIIPAELAENQPQRLRLRIWHLMVWMGMTGLVLALYDVGQLEQQAAAAGHPLGVKFQFMFIVQAISSGLCITSLFLVVERWRDKKVRFPIHPGHWLLIANGLTTIAYLVPRRIYQFCVPYDENRLNLLAANTTGALCSLMVGASMSVVILTQFRERAWFAYVLICLPLEMLRIPINAWIWFAAIRPDLAPGYLVWRADQQVEVLLQVLNFSGIVLASLIDRRRQIPRDWLHFLAIVMLVLMHCFQLAAHWQLI